MKILLCSVFGPYGVDDEYGRKENVMELFHNQVTREQGLFSLRFHHQSFGLHLIAENLAAPTVVLDFPSQRRFVRELAAGYDYVGISFIVPNFKKAQRMAELVRRFAPASKIVLGGHGTHIPGLENLIDHDYICRGEGVRWFRELLGEDPERPLAHPKLLSAFDKRLMGIPLATNSAVLLPGVGCPNGCRFCATSHFFQRRYVSFFDTGKELFDICRDLEESLGVEEFFVMDENFLKRRARVRELLDLMQRHDKVYRFGIFSSAETIAEVGVEFLARLGVHFLWLGVESKREIYEKNRGIDLPHLVKDLRDHGINVLTSGILFLEHHDPETIWEDIRYLVGLESDFVQFMGLGPLPQTKLFRDYQATGRLLEDMPYEEWHGQHMIWFDHPHFSPAVSAQLLKAAFRYDYDQQGSSFLRLCDTLLRGHATLARYPDAYMRKRRALLGDWAQSYRPGLAVLERYAHNARVKQLTRALAARYRRELGPASVSQLLRSKAALALAAMEDFRIRTGRAMYQPKTLHTGYRVSLAARLRSRLETMVPLPLPAPGH